MSAPEIDSDRDDGDIPMPTPLPMAVAVYMDFPTSALPSRAGNAVSPGMHTEIDNGHIEGGLTHARPQTPTHPGNAHSPPESHRKFHEPPAVRRSVRGISSPEYDIDDLDSHVSRPQVRTAHHAEDMRGEPHAPHAGLTTPAPMPATVADPHSVDPQSVHRNALPARSAPTGKDGEPAAGGSASDGFAHAPKGSAPAKLKSEITYRFSSWGEDASVALKFEHMHPGSQVLVTPSNEQVHRILNAFLQRQSREANSRPVLRLTDRTDLWVGNSTKRGRKQRHNQN